MARYTASKPEMKATLDVLEGNFLKLLEAAKPKAEVRPVGLIDGTPHTGKHVDLHVVLYSATKDMRVWLPCNRPPVARKHR